MCVTFDRVSIFSQTRQRLFVSVQPRFHFTAVNLSVTPWCPKLIRARQSNQLWVLELILDESLINIYQTRLSWCTIKTEILYLWTLVLVEHLQSIYIKLLNYLRQKEKMVGSTLGLGNCSNQDAVREKMEDLIADKKSN